jgi:hypothetical protein
MDSGQRMPKVTVMSRLVSGRRFDRNPLRRPSDRAETVVLIMLVVVFLISAPLVALASGAWARAAAQRAELAQAASWHQVSAVVLVAAGPPAMGSGNSISEAKAHWIAPDGTAVTGDLPVPYGTQAGATLRVWVTPDGRLTQQPMTDSQVTNLTVTAEVGAVAALALVVALAGTLTRWLLDRRRMADWDADWHATGPRWTTHA